MVISALAHVLLLRLTKCCIILSLLPSRGSPTLMHRIRACTPWVFSVTYACGVRVGHFLAYTFFRKDLGSTSSSSDSGSVVDPSSSSFQKASHVLAASLCHLLWRVLFCMDSGGLAYGSLGSWLMTRMPVLTRNGTSTTGIIYKL
ncbi:hypothetical protein JB92DRAFT_3100484 [Gautieria morchelliformis]|nr:hypothetical protein JB92DRAFT_3100484 [Gautieria morchelliformis]